MGSRQHNIRQKTPKYPVTHIYAGYTPPPSSVVRAMLFAYKQMDHGDNFVHLHYVPFLSFAWTINGNVNRVQSFRRAAVQQKIYKLTSTTHRSTSHTVWMIQIRCAKMIFMNISIFSAVSHCLLGWWTLRPCKLRVVFYASLNTFTVALVGTGEQASFTSSGRKRVSNCLVKWKYWKAVAREWPGNVWHKKWINVFLFMRQQTD